jgi:DNA-binding response OmpR family regulator
VLLVEDDLLLARQLVRLLRRHGYDVTHVQTCAVARTVEGPFDLAVLDGELPDGYGCELLGELLEAGTVPCAVFFTGSRDPGVVLSASGFTRSVAKIDGVEPLLQAMAATLEEQLRVAEAAGAESTPRFPDRGRDTPRSSTTRRR